MNEKNKSEILIYQTEDGETKVDVRFYDENIWITAKSMAELFKSDYSNILKHIKNIYKDNELQENTTMAKFATVVKRGFRGELEDNIEHYNLDMVISVGYRVKSTTAIHFRQWATRILKEYIKKGFVLDDERLKQKNNNYFDELLDKIRDIRSSEKVFYSKILDIYATSIDYDPKMKISQDFFATVQNKMHWAVHNHTAAELIFERANADKDFMGITNIKRKLKRDDVVCAKNYLNEDEIQVLNRLVNMYLEYAELQAFEKKPMTMKDWIDKLDIFLSMTNKKVLTDKGTISHIQAEEKAINELKKYNDRIKNNKLSEVEKHYLESLANMEEKVKKIKKEKIV